MPTTLQKLSAALAGTPDVPTAEERAIKARQVVIDAGAAVTAARAALSASDEAGEAVEIQKREAALIAAERVADRAIRLLALAEKRLEEVQAAAGASARAEGVKALKLATEWHDKSATKAQQAVDALAAAVADLDEADEAIAALQRQGIGSRNAVAGSNFGPGATRSRIRIELVRARLSTGGYIPEDVPNLSQWSTDLGRLLQSA